MLKKIKEDLINRKTFHIHGLKDWIFLKWQYFSNWSYGQRIFNKCTKIIKWGKKIISTNGTDTTAYLHTKEKCHITPYIKTQNEIEDLNVRTKRIKLLGERPIKQKSSYPWISPSFLRYNMKITSDKGNHHCNQF